MTVKPENYVHARGVLPRFAMPEHFVHLDSIPYTANMKANRLELARTVIPKK